MDEDHSSSRRIMLLAIAIAAVITMLFLERIPQDPAYHSFADSREIATLPNFANICSNLLFLFVGLYGLQRRPLLRKPETRPGYTALSLGILCIGLGSVHYHWAPSTPALFWDRLPMSITFMALFSLLLEERVFPTASSKTLWPLLAMGIGSAAYWHWSEAQGLGDLRPYALVQFLPMALIPAILLLFPAKYLHSERLWAGLALYTLAKLCELFDREILAASTMVSGHTLKHLLSGLAALCMLLAVPVRERTRKRRRG
ncbi:ceramidase domain-containing protein [Thiovibrio frasassiensis]|uniref:Ceramidase n=1 Tax=Thiovibrio frasassiensis TaxID=2984131 RepID=A0A9X4RL16_9BACT|nr:ceramidase domain-containing protein [Thiovibrio frasassiensis]MDG4475179.1 ceramidase [Thiovibrio frasassiensis]